MNNVILSYGLGVESTAILVRWCVEPETRPCNLDRLTVVTAMTGDEYADTGRLVEAHILPLMRNHGIRFVQVARRGHLEADGIIVLSDTHDPQKLFIEGGYKLSDELREAGTVPSYAGAHVCSQKFKVFPIESWMRDFYRVPVFSHVLGYNADETNRVRASEEANAVRNVAFGFNADEMTRVTNAIAHDSPRRKGIYPLVEWGWTRQDCVEYLTRILGTPWAKSCCVYCPFSNNKQNRSTLVARHKLHPEQTAEALMLEHMSMSLNPRGALYRDVSLVQLTTESENARALDLYHEKLERSEWAIYRVRRLYSAKAVKLGPVNPLKKGSAQRAVEKLEVHPSREAAISALHIKAVSEGAEIEEVRNIIYAYVERRGASYPARENFLVAAPNSVETKARYGIEKFDAQWEPGQYVLPILHKLASDLG